MLLEKTGEVMTLKLQSGDEVITRIEEENQEFLICDNCVTIAATPQGVAMVPWIQTGKQGKVSINKKQIVARVTTVKEIADKYLEMVTGISVSSPSSILGI
jgi:Fe2+ or Zn2+ uptake regulation protein